MEVKTVIGKIEKEWSFDNDVNALLSAGWKLTARGMENGVLYAFLEREKLKNCLKVEVIEDEYGNPQTY